MNIFEKVGEAFGDIYTQCWGLGHPYWLVKDLPEVDVDEATYEIIMEAFDEDYNHYCETQGNLDE